MHTYSDLWALIVTYDRSFVGGLSAVCRWFVGGRILSHSGGTEFDFLSFSPRITRKLVGQFVSLDVIGPCLNRGKNSKTGF